jgi:hypothetical protein
VRRRQAAKSSKRDRRRDPIGDRGARRRVRRNRLLALSILAILCLAALVPAGQASGGAQAQSERAEQRAQRLAQRTSEREGIRQAREEAKALDKARRAARQAEREAIRRAAKSTEHALVSIGCEQITIQFHGFNVVPGKDNAVAEKVIFRQLPAPMISYVFAPSGFSFKGSEATQTIPIAAPLGKSSITLKAHFNVNGMHGSFEAREPLTCGAISAFTLETRQSLGGPFTTGTVPGEVGQAVSYETVAINTGNTPLRFSGFSDPGCDGPVAGGSEDPIVPRGSVAFVCTHTLTDADRSAGLFANAASVLATPAVGGGAVTPIVHGSPGVIVSPITVGESVKPPTKDPASTPKTEAGSTTTSTPTTAQTKSAVLFFATAGAPALRGPKSCVRGAFTAAVKAGGVSSVIFYLDGHKLARRTAHSASKGWISIKIDGSRLKPGTHRLLARITMAQSSPTAKAAVLSRSLKIVRCAKAALTHH